jgi:IPT/TIG domain
MGDFSEQPSKQLAWNKEKGHTGIHIEQGVPILDRDLNLIHDLLAARIDTLFSRYVGNGLAAGVDDGFAIRPLGPGEDVNDFEITAPGRCLVEGIEVCIKKSVRYLAQPATPGHRTRPCLTTPDEAQKDPRRDIVYLDVVLIEVDSVDETDLANATDVGMQTSVRLKPTWTVLVAEGHVEGTPLPAPPGHLTYPLARLLRPRGEGSIVDGIVTVVDEAGKTSEQPRIVDLRQRRLTVSDIEQRLSLMERVLIAPRLDATSSDTQPFTPKSGVISNNITLHGGNLDKGTVTVLFGDKEAIAFERQPNQLTTLVPGGLTPDGVPRRVPITVKNEVGSAVSDAEFNVLASPTFVAAPAPQVSPAAGTEGSEVTLFGFNLALPMQDSEVRFGDTLAPEVTSAENEKLRVKIPRGPLGAVHITVKTAEGEATTIDTFDVLPPPPEFETTPFTTSSRKIGELLVLRGRNFDFKPKVAFVGTGFADTDAPDIASVTMTRISVKVPPIDLGPQGIRQARIRLTTDGGGPVVTASTVTITPESNSPKRQE